MSSPENLIIELEERRIRRLGGSREIPVDVRIVSATHQDLPQAISEGRFREDLFYRLNTFTIRIPPLRVRPEDILLLAEHFLHRYAREVRKPIEAFTPQAVAHLKGYLFPGNVRELRNMIERAVILCKTDRVAPEDLEFQAYVPLSSDEGAPSPSEPGPDGDSGSPGASNLVAAAGLNLSALEKEAIREALRQCNGNQVQAARLLGVSRHFLRRRITRHNLNNPE